MRAWHSVVLRLRDFGSEFSHSNFYIFTTTVLDLSHFSAKFDNLLDLIVLLTPLALPHRLRVLFSDSITCNCILLPSWPRCTLWLVVEDFAWENVLAVPTCIKFWSESSCFCYLPWHPYNRVLFILLILLFFLDYRIFVVHLFRSIRLLISWHTFWGGLPSTYVAWLWWRNWHHLTWGNQLDLRWFWVILFILVC